MTGVVLTPEEELLKRAAQKIILDPTFDPTVPAPFPIHDFVEATRKARATDGKFLCLTCLYTRPAGNHYPPGSRKV